MLKLFYKSVEFVHKVVVSVALVPVYLYRVVRTGRSCKFVPTCSMYTIQSVKRFGIFKGYWMGTRRIVRCRPKNGGYDPVPYRYSGGARWVI